MEQRFFCFDPMAFPWDQNKLFNCGRKDCIVVLRFSYCKVIGYCNVTQNPDRSEDISWKYVAYCSWDCMLQTLPVEFLSVA